METPVKERLAGAIILVVLLAILVPEFLSGPKHTPPSPSAGEGVAVRTYTIDLAAPGTVKPVQATGEQKPVAIAPPAVNAPPAVLEQGNTPASAPPPLPSPSSASTQAQSQPPAATASLETPASSKAPAEETNTRSAAPASGWAVQLGSFSKSDNAQRLTQELRSRGYKAFVSRTGTGAKLRYRVRVGPEEERSQAQKLAERLKREGRQVSVVPLSQ